MKLWIDFIKKTPNFKFYSVDKTNNHILIDKNNLSKYWSDKASSHYSNSRVLCKK